MVKQNPQLDWERLLDGATYTLELGEIGWKGSLNDLRAKIHYEADRRHGIVHTTKISARKLQFYGEDCMVIVNPGRCTCGAQPGLPHTLGCLMFQTMPTPKLPENHPDFVPTPPAVCSPGSPPHRRHGIPAPRPAPVVEPAPDPAPAPTIPAPAWQTLDPNVWPAYGTWPPVPEGEEPRFFTSEEELAAWEEEVEKLRAVALAELQAAVVQGLEAEVEAE